MQVPRALQKGMMGMGQASLAPSLAALGPNRYLREKDFFTMLVCAMVAHLVVILIMGILPKEKVTDIPVRALSFKIGGQDRIAAFGLPMGIGTNVAAPTPAPAPQPVQRPKTEMWRATPKENVVVPAPLEPIPFMSAPKAVAAPSPVKTIPVAPPEQRQMPEENRVDPLPAIEPVPTRLTTPPPVIVPQPQMPSPLPSTEILTQVASPAIAPQPQRFVREVGAAPNTGLGQQTGSAGGQGIETTMTPTTLQAIRERYEQQISSWIQQHKVYPAAAAGAEGRVVARMRIDRSGYVRYYAIEQSSGNNALDAAAIDMIRRANPVPAVPANYPAGSLIEFLIPITFRVPQ